MNTATHPAYDSDLLDTPSQRVMVGDGGMGTQLQAAQLEGATRFSTTRGPTSSRRNTFGCNLVSPDDYEIADGIRERWLEGTEIARGSAR